MSAGFGSATLIAEVIPRVRKFGDAFADAVVVVVVFVGLLVFCAEDHILSLSLYFLSIVICKITKPKVNKSYAIKKICLSINRNLKIISEQLFS